MLMKKTSILAVLLTGTLQLHAQVACPATLITGELGKNNIKLSFMNKGKLPLQQLDFICTPPADKKSRDSICHTETGIFYPGNEYSINFAYAMPSRNVVTVSLKTALLAGGGVWTSKAQPCHPLKISRKH
jgi:hypothetical protein